MDDIVSIEVEDIAPMEVEDIVPISSDSDTESQNNTEGFTLYSDIPASGILSFVQFCNIETGLSETCIALFSQGISHMSL